MCRTIGAALIAAAALGLSSCGGTEAKLTRAQFVSRMDAVCAQARGATEAQARANRAAEGTPQERFFAAYIGGQRVFLRGLGAINPPDAAKQDLHAFEQGVRQRLVLLERLHGADAAGMRSMVAATQGEQRAIFERLDAIAHRYRLIGCA